MSEPSLVQFRMLSWDDLTRPLRGLEDVEPAPPTAASQPINR